MAVHTEFHAPGTLEAGDGIHLDSTMEHACLTAQDGPSRNVCVGSGNAQDPYEQLRSLADDAAHAAAA